MQITKETWKKLSESQNLIKQISFCNGEIKTLSSDECELLRFYVDRIYSCVKEINKLNQVTKDRFLQNIQL